MVTYFQDTTSHVVIQMHTDHDAKEMRKHPEYKEVTEKDYKLSTEPKKVDKKES